MLHVRRARDRSGVRAELLRGLGPAGESRRGDRGRARRLSTGAWLRSSAGCLCAGIAIYLALYAGFYPRTFSILDEQAYLTYGLLLSQGEVFADPSSPPARTLDVAGRLAPRTPLGTPLLLAPAIALDWHAAFAVTLLIHLLGTAACIAALRKLGLPSAYALLYLFHPVGSLYARTVMSDVPTMTLSMLGVHAALSPRSRPFVAGLAFGALPHFRFAQLVTPLAIALAFGVRDALDSRAAGRLRLARSAWLCAGLAPGILSWLLVNRWLYGGPLTLPLTFGLSAENIPANLARYLFTQNLIYPGLLIVGLLRRWPLRAEAALVAASMLFLYGMFPFVYQGFGPGALLIGDRFFLPLFPWLLPPYAMLLEALAARAGRLRMPAYAAALALLVAGYAALSALHDAELRRQQEIQQALYRSTPEGALLLLNPDAREFVFAGLGRRETVSFTALLEGGPDFDPGLPARIARALPDAYVFATERLDRDENPRQSGKALLARARENYMLEEVARIESWPERALLYRITSPVAPGAGEPAARP